MRNFLLGLLGIGIFCQVSTHSRQTWCAAYEEDEIRIPDPENDPTERYEPDDAEGEVWRHPWVWRVEEDSPQIDL